MSFLLLNRFFFAFRHLNNFYPIVVAQFIARNAQRKEGKVKRTGTLAASLALVVLALAYSGTAWAGGELPTPASTPSPLRLSVGAPDRVEAGSRFSFTVRVENTTDNAIFFDATVAFVGTTWGQGVESTTPGPGTEIYWSVGTANGITHWWRGTAPARGTAWLAQTVNLGAARTTDTQLFVSAQYRGLSTVKSITIVPASTPTPTQTPASTATPSPARTATPSPTATAQPTPDIHIGAGYSGAIEWPRGEYRTIAVAISVQNSIAIFDWVTTEFTDSTCGLDGVPASRQDYFTGTYTNVYHRVGVLANTVLGMCRINGRVTFQGSGRTLNFYTELRVVPAPTATPTATPSPQPSPTATSRPRLPGDANGDGKVNIEDFSLLAASFGKCQNDPGYDSRANFASQDNCITALDFSVLAANFGRRLVE